MKQSQLFPKTLKETPREAIFISHRLLLRGGFIYQIASGMYALLPLGFRTLKRIESIIREEFDKINVQELRMSLLHPAELWKKTGRFETAGKELWKVKSRRGEDMVLAMTHEETIAAIAADTVRSEAGLPVIVNQFQTKIRDEERPRGGLLRLREFIMQDAYSFDKDEQGLGKSFQKMIGVYKKIFKRMMLPVIPVKASSGLMGGGDSYEFMVVAESGEDKIAVCPKCGFAANVEILGERERCPKCGTKMEIKRTIEVAHAFKLGTKYSQAMNILWEDKRSEKHLVQMGCYGIGLERAIATIIEVNHDDKGIIWPSSVAPFDVHLLALGSGKKAIENKIKRVSEKLYQDLQKAKIEVLYDDRQDKSAGEKFADADLIGIPLRLVVSERTIKQNCAELKERSGEKTKLVKLNQIKDYVK
jgi:prolyl-tRNA synthetase